MNDTSLTIVVNNCAELWDWNHVWVWVCANISLRVLCESRTQYHATVMHLHGFHWPKQHEFLLTNLLSQKIRWIWQERRTSTHNSSSIFQITHMVFADTVLSYPSTNPVLISGKTFSVKGSSVLGTVFLSMSSTPPRLTPSRTASMLTGRPSDMEITTQLTQVTSK